MLIGIIADDFTGASDIANTLARGRNGRGLRTVQYLGVPEAAAAPEAEAGVIALKTRSIHAADAVSQSLAALEWLQRQGCRQIVFKYCSTFDSTPDGNIGPVAEAIARALRVKGVVACPAFPGAGRTVYQGHLFVHDRLLSESGLERHPLNPMTDPDLRRWLARQVESSVGLVPWPVVDRGPDAIAQALGQAGDDGELLVVVDALSNRDLVAIGEACADTPLLTGGSGIAIGLPENFIRKGLARGVEPRGFSADGPGAVLAGSCSQATQSQVVHYAVSHPSLAIDVDAVMNGTCTVDRLLDFAIEHSGEAPLIYSSAAPDAVAKLQAVHGREAVAHRLDGLFADLAYSLIEAGIRRLVVAGGETSGAVVSALDVQALEIGTELAPGVPLLLWDRAEPVVLALKSGNFGGPDFFAESLRTMARGR